MNRISFSLRKRLRAAEGDIEIAVAMDLAEGDFPALFGKSGAGKTTILRMVAGLTTPDEGFLRVDGKTWYDSAQGIDLPPEQRRAGLVFQDYALFPNLTVRGNLEFALRGRAGRPRVEALLETCGLRALSDRLPDSLSGGERQRTALARALVNGPSLLLLDEPFSAVDGAMRLRLQEQLAALLAEARIPAILVSHDVSEVCRLCPRVHVLERGRIARSGPPQQVFAPASADGDDARAPFRLAGVLLEKAVRDGVHALTVLAGEEAFTVECAEVEAGELRAGDKVLLIARDFRPRIVKLG